MIKLSEPCAERPRYNSNMSIISDTPDDTRDHEKPVLNKLDVPIKKPSAMSPKQRNGCVGIQTLDQNPDKAVTIMTEMSRVEN